MPLVTVKVFERRLDAQSEARIIKAMTDALLSALEAEELRDHTWGLVRATTLTAGAGPASRGKRPEARLEQDPENATSAAPGSLQAPRSLRSGSLRGALLPALCTWRAAAVVGEPFLVQRGVEVVGL